MRKKNKRYTFGAAEFKKLQDEWYAKLRSIGFPDIEKNEYHVKQYSSNAYRQASPLDRETRERYYTAMQQQYEDFVFTSPEQQYIIKRTCEGAILQEVSKEIKMDRRTVSYIIRRFEHDTGVREWAYHQRYRVKK